MSRAVARSYLYVPGNRPDRFEKACAAGADAVIIDLEDAVPHAEKAAARATLAAWLSPARAVIVRVNGADTEWFADDLAACGAAGVVGVVLPKAEKIGDAVVSLCRRTGAALLPLIETAAGKAHHSQGRAHRTRSIRRVVSKTCNRQEKTHDHDRVIHTDCRAPGIRRIPPTAV